MTQTLDQNEVPHPQEDTIYRHTVTGVATKVIWVTTTRVLSQNKSLHVVVTTQKRRMIGIESKFTEAQLEEILARYWLCNEQEHVGDAYMSTCTITPNLAKTVTKLCDPHCSLTCRSKDFLWNSTHTAILRENTITEREREGIDSMHKTEILVPYYH